MQGFQKQLNASSIGGRQAQLFTAAACDDQGPNPFLPRRPVENGQRHSFGNVLTGYFEATQMWGNEYYSFAQLSRCFHMGPTLAFDNQLVDFTIGSEPNFRQLHCCFTRLTNGFMKQ